MLTVRYVMVLWLQDLLHWGAADEHIWAPGVWWGLYFERLVSVVAPVERVSMYGVTK